MWVYLNPRNFDGKCLENPVEEGMPCFKDVDVYHRWGCTITTQLVYRNSVQRGRPCTGDVSELKAHRKLYNYNAFFLNKMSVIQAQNINRM